MAGGSRDPTSATSDAKAFQQLGLSEEAHQGQDYHNHNNTSPSTGNDSSNSDEITLRFTNHSQAAQWENRNRSFKVTINDPTFPHDQQQQQEWVVEIIKAFHHNQGLLDNLKFIKQWGNILRGQKKTLDTEVLAWKFLNRVMLYHTIDGKLEPDNTEAIGEEKGVNFKYHNFAHHMVIMLDALRIRKTLCKHLIAEDWTSLFIDAPKTQTSRVDSNRMVNGKKKANTDTGAAAISILQSECNSIQDVGNRTAAQKLLESRPITRRRSAAVAASSSASTNRRGEKKTAPSKSLIRTVLNRIVKSKTTPRTRSTIRPNQRGIVAKHDNDDDDAEGEEDEETVAGHLMAINQDFQGPEHHLSNVGSGYYSDVYRDTGDQTFNGSLTTDAPASTDCYSNNINASHHQVYHGQLQTGFSPSPYGSPQHYIQLPVIDPQLLAESVVPPTETQNALPYNQQFPQSFERGHSRQASGYSATTLPYYNSNTYSRPLSTASSSEFLAERTPSQYYGQASQPSNSRFSTASTVVAGEWQTLSEVPPPPQMNRERCYGRYGAANFGIEEGWAAQFN